MDFDVLVIGGGIQGAGLLHDLASRRISVHLLEERQLSVGTSSRSTKLIHGGLRYLERVSQWPLVYDALHERALLLRLLGNIVRPLPIVLPTGAGSRPPWLVGLGLGLYDLMAGDSGLPRAQRISANDVRTFAPYLKPNQNAAQDEDAFLFYDAQMIDDAIVRLAARAGSLMGGSYEEWAQVTAVEPLNGGGFKVSGTYAKDQGGGGFEYRAKMVLVAAGAWTNWNLVRWGIAPRVPCVLNTGTHMILPSAAVAATPERCAASLVQHTDGRVLFFIPWFGRWLFGTTESPLIGDPRQLKPPPADLEYLRNALEMHFQLADGHSDPEEIFCGVRTMPLKHLRAPIKLTEAYQKDPFSSPAYALPDGFNLSHLSRESVVDEPSKDLLAIYGGKYTTYRSLSERIGRIVKDRLGIGGPSLTRSPDAWFLEKLLREEPELFASSSELRKA